MGNTIGNNNNFLRLTSSSTTPKSKTAQLSTIKSAANNIKQARASYKAENAQNVKTSSIFSAQSSTPSTQTKGGKSVSYSQFTEAVTGKKLDELTKAEKAQFQMVSALMDADGDNRINEDEAERLAALDGNNEEISQEDIDKLYEELGVTNEAEFEKLMSDVDEILNAENKTWFSKVNDAVADAVEKAKTAATKSTGSTAATNSTGSTAATKSTGSTAATNSTGSTAATNSTGSTAATNGTKYQPDSKMNTENGIVFDEETGEYSVKVEKWTGASGENSSLYGIMGNAYSDLSATEKQQVLSYIQEMNPEITDVNLIYTDQNIKLPVLTYDENGNVTGYKETADKVEDTSSTETTGSTAATTSTGSTAATKSTGSTATTSTSKNDAYINDVVENAKEFLTDAKDGDYSEFAAYVEKSIDNTSLTEADKNKMFNNLLEVAKDGNVGYEFVTSFGDKVSDEVKANAVLNLVNDKTYSPEMYTNVANDYVLASMKEMVAAGNIDKALALETAYNNRFGSEHGGNDLRYSSITSEDWAQYTADLYAKAAEQGKLDEILGKSQYDSVTALQDGVKGKAEDKLMDQLFTNLSSVLPDEANIKQADADAFAVRLSSGSVEENLNEVLNSKTLDNTQKAYYLKQIMSSSDFTEEFRDMKAGKQEDLLKAILAQVANYTSV